MSFNSSRQIKSTRKPHRCEWCSQIIEEGSPASYASGVWEGDFYSQYFHGECSAALKHEIESNGGELEDFSGQYARGRADDDFELPPQFNPDGTKIQ